MLSSAAAAMAVVALQPRPANAQAFVGTPTTASGTVTYDRGTPTVETITVNTNTATINWTATGSVTPDGTIIFLPLGNTATFTNGASVSDFTVLNRIGAGVPIEFNGHVISQLQSASGTATGGHVWFYNPGGIIVGATAVFDVGGLLLTTNDPLTFSATGNGFAGNFVASANSTASVRIDPGAQINATPENSYVALVAPRVQQGGTVTVNGSAAYVGGEDVTLTMNQGLFDIAVNVGTSDPFNPDSGNGVVHTGTTTGPASTGAGDNHRIYMVAVPKNQALTMLLAGNAGFTPASSVSLDNGQIVLAAGSNVSETSGTLTVTSPGTVNADLKIDTGTYTSDVRAFARGDIDVTADTGNISFSRDVSLRSLLAGDTGLVSVGASGGNTLSIGRNLTMVTSGATFSSGAPEELNLLVDGGTVTIGGNLNMFAGAAADGTQGDVEITVNDQGANQGSLSVTGQTFISTSVGAADVNPDVGSTDNFAGDITIEALNGGSISLHNTTLVASANGQDNSGNGSGFDLGRAGDGFAGDITVSADGGDITVTGNLSASADGIGGRMLDGGLFGGAGFGGSIDVSTFDGSIHITGTTFLSALGVGGGFIGTGTPGSAQGGSGFGGDATIFVGGTGFNTDPSSITLDGDTTIRADGTGGNGQTGGFGSGGSAGISGNKGTITLDPTAIINISARGTGGNANVGFGGDGGDGFGGDAFINALAVPPGVEQFATASTITGGNATLDVTGTGGIGGTGNGDNLAAGAGGDGFGGAPCQGECSSGGASALASVDGGSLTLGNVTFLANGVGGTGGVGGNDQVGGAGGQGFGGGVQVGLVDRLFSPTGAADGEAHYGNILAFASGNGGAGGAGGSSISGPMPDGDGGAGQGGTASLWSNSLVTAASVTFFANANGGDGGNGGSALGGFSSITSNDAFIFIDDILTRVDGSVDITGDVTLEGAAASGNGSTGTTGDARGGTAEIRADGGDMTVGGDVFVGADGDAEDGVFGGTGEGGLATIDAYDGASLSAASLTAQALGEGGNGSASAGTGDGGTARVRSHSGGSITTGNLTVDASATGGNSVTGGDAFGGDAEASAFEQDSKLTVTGLATVKANGIGGIGTIGGAGGSGFGGSAKMYAGVGDSGTGGATVTIQNALLQANGTGGTGGTGGSGYGGGDVSETEGVQIGARLGTLTITGTLTADADGQGGDGLAGPGGSGMGGNVLAGANFIDDVGTATATLGAADLSALGFGGAGGGSGAAGGSGEGGEVEIGVPTAGSVVNATSLTLHAGGAGGTGGSGATGGAGGDGTGGHTHIDIAAGSANLGVIQSFARGFGGFGGDGSSGVGGDGGSGFGGFSEITVNSTLNATSYTGLALGFGGNGGLGTTAGVGGFGGGSSASFDVLAGGDATFTGALSLSAAGIGGTGSDGGTGSGSSATINIAAGGSLSTADLFVDANAFGGDGSSGEGGDAFGGFATVANDGDLTVTDETFISADAQGGDGLTLGGSGFGGFARAWASGVGITTFGPNSELSADGGGGAASAGTGGDGIGGFALLQAFGGGTMSGGSAGVTAGGFGGGGLAGGEGIGGTFFGEGSGGAYIESSGTDSVVDFSGTLTANAVGLGGNSSAGIRGNGSGGLAIVGAYDGGSTTAAGVFIETSGLDGTGTGPATGTGGTATLEARGGTVSVGGATVLSHGSAQGGEVEISSTSNFGSGSGNLTIDFLTAAANGPTAGDIRVTVENGSAADLGVATLTATGSSGGSITIDIGGVPLAAFGGIGTLSLLNTVLTADSLSLNTSGDIDIVSQNGASIDVSGTFAANAAGAITLDDIDGTAVVRADVIDFNANSFSSTFDILGRMVSIYSVQDLNVTSTIIVADETLTLSSDNDVIAGDLSAGLAINLFAGHDITAGDLDSGGDVTAEAPNNITLGDITAVGRVDLESDGSGGLGNIIFGDVTADVLDFSADGTVNGGDIVAVTKATGDSEGAIVLGNITVTGPEAPDDFSVGIGSETSVTVGNVSAVGRVGFATLGDLTTGNITAGPLFLALVSGDVTVGSVTTAPTGQVYIADSSMFIAAGGGGETDDFDVSQVLPLAPVATGGSILITGPVSTGVFQAAAGTDFDSADITAGESIAITAGGDVATLDLDAGQTVTLTAGNNVIVDDVDAGTSAEFTADGVAIFLGTVSSPEITVTSADIDIVGQLGVHGVTDLITLNAVSDGAPILIGGEEGEVTALAEGLQYWLSNDEEIQGDSIVFNAFGEGEIPTPTVLVSDFEIEGSATPGGGASHVELNTDGTVHFNGLLAYTGAAATDELLINAGEIQVNTSTGGRIAMVDASLEAPSGLLELNADNIWVGDQALLDNLNTNVNFVGRDDAVGTNNGDVVPEGWLIAGGMTLGIGNTLFVQNSGSGSDFAGITVGDGGLTIRTTGEAPAEVVAYGRKLNANGTFTTGNAFFNLVNFSFADGSVYTDLAEFNECLINTGCVSGGGIGGPGPEDILGPIDLMNDPQETTEGTDDEPGGGQGSRAELIDVGALSEDELIDEGVTSGGDNNQWEAVCREDPNDPRCPADDGKKKEEPAQ